jgi:hypothetical protein
MICYGRIQSGKLLDCIWTNVSFEGLPPEYIDITEQPGDKRVGSVLMDGIWQAPTIRVITLAAFLARLTPTEYAGMQANPRLGYALACQLAEPTATVNLDSPRMPQLLGLAVQVGAITPARAAELQRDGTADEAAG